MSVPCAACGREYDVTLFEFGRTIECTCGARVGLEPRVRELRAGEDLRFIADAMLGSLARWLRIAGFDAAYEAHIPDEHLVRRALEEDRVILTRDRGIAREWRVPRLYRVDADSTLAQLREVLLHFGLTDSVRLFRRCSLCNAELRRATVEEVAAKVPPRVRRELDEFRICPICERVYWEGSHADRMRATLRETMQAVPDDDPMEPEPPE